MGAIEWPGGVSSAMTLTVEDNTLNPASILDVDLDATLKIEWSVPPAFADIICGEFRLRAYAESIGPGPEKQIGNDKLVPVVVGQEPYVAEIIVDHNTLLGEGQHTPAGVPVSGVYRLVAVLQHLNDGVRTTISGFDEVTLRMFRKP